MTIDELQAAFDDVSFPGISFKVKRRSPDPLKIGLKTVDLYARVVDSRDAEFELTIKRTFQVHPLPMTPYDVSRVAFQEIVAFLAHEAAERFNFKGQRLYDPHVHGDPNVTVRIT